MSLLRLVLEIFVGLVKALQFQTANLDRARERATGATLQREEDMRHEETRIQSADRADADSGGLPEQPDPLDRDRTI